MYYDEIDKKIRKLIWTKEIFLESFSNELNITFLFIENLIKYLI